MSSSSGKLQLLAHGRHFAVPQAPQLRKLKLYFEHDGDEPLEFSTGEFLAEGLSGLASLKSLSVTDLVSLVGLAPPEDYEVKAVHFRAWSREFTYTHTCSNCSGGTAALAASSDLRSTTIMLYMTVTRCRCRVLQAQGDAPFLPTLGELRLDVNIEFTGGLEHLAELPSLRRVYVGWEHGYKTAVEDGALDGLTELT